MTDSLMQDEPASTVTHCSPPPPPSPALDELVLHPACDQAVAASQAKTNADRTLVSYLREEWNEATAHRFRGRGGLFLEPREAGI